MGVALGRGGLERRFGKGTTLTLALASNLPDVDALLTLPYGALAFAHRRGVTHSVVGVPFLCALLAWLLHRRDGAQSWRRLFALSFLGAVVHVAFDLVNSYGVMLLHPFTRARWEAGCVFIIDLALWAILLGMLLVPRLRLGAARAWNDRERVARVACVLVAVYVAACFGLRGRAGGLLAHVHDHTPGRPVAGWSYVFPEAFGPHRFRGVHRHGDVWELWRLHPLSGRAELVETVRTDEAHPLVEAVRATAGARVLDSFWKAPVWTVRGRTVEVRDLRFQSVVIRRLRAPFVFRFEVAPDGAVRGAARVVGGT